MYRSSHSITHPDMCVLGVNADDVMWHVASIMCTKTWNVPSTVSGSVQTPHKQLLNHKHASNLKSSYCEGDEMTETGLWWKACCVVTVHGQKHDKWKPNAIYCLSHLPEYVPLITERRLLSIFSPQAEHVYGHQIVNIMSYYKIGSRFNEK